MDNITKELIISSFIISQPKFNIHVISDVDASFVSWKTTWHNATPYCSAFAVIFSSCISICFRENKNDS